MNVKWSNEEFKGVPVPESTQDFLVREGLPEVIPFTTIEFGPALIEPCEGLIIGCDLDWPIIVDCQGCVNVHYESGPALLNSSVQLLAATINEYLELKNCGEEEVATGVERFRSFLTGNDPRTLSEESSVWRSLIDDFEAMAT